VSEITEIDIGDAQASHYERWVWIYFLCRLFFLLPSAISLWIIYVRSFGRGQVGETVEVFHTPKIFSIPKCFPTSQNSQHATRRRVTLSYFDVVVLIFDFHFFLKRHQFFVPFPRSPITLRNINDCRDFD
jgi:hypothetical protein